MTDPRTRTAAGTKMQQVYRAICVGHESVAAIAQATGLAPTAVYTAVKWLKAGGYVRRADSQRRWARWIKVAGRVYRGDRRGKHKNSRNHYGPIARAKWVRMMAAKYGPGWSPPRPVIPRDAHPLAQAWAAP